MNRFDYIAFDSQSIKIQADIKHVARQLEALIETSIQCPRSKASALTNLELVYMWVGKGVRNDQAMRNQLPPVLQEERNNL